APAVHFGAVDPHGGIGAGQNGVGQRLVKARPASAALELGLGIEQRQGAAGAAKGAGAVFVEQRRAARRFGALLAQDVVDVGAQPLPPFGIGNAHFVGGGPGGRRLGGNGRHGTGLQGVGEGAKGGDRGTAKQQIAEFHRQISPFGTVPPRRSGARAVNS